MIKLHLGCGWRDFGPSWQHIDAGDYPHLDSFDITKLPYEDGTVDLIYASHVLEYFDRDEAIRVLREWSRVLKSGGIMRIAVPDFHTLISLYYYGDVQIEQILGPLYGKMPMGDQTIYHKTAYNFKSLSRLMEECGISDVSHYNWRTTEHAKFDDHSQAYIPHMDKENGRLVSLNVQGVKK